MYLYPNLAITIFSFNFSFSYNQFSVLVISQSCYFFFQFSLTKISVTAAKPKSTQKGLVGAVLGRLTRNGPPNRGVRSPLEKEPGPLPAGGWVEGVDVRRGP